MAGRLHLTGRLGDEIAQLRGKRAAFAPHWVAPDRVAHVLKRGVPLWVVGSVFALAGLLEPHRVSRRPVGLCQTGMRAGPVRLNTESSLISGTLRM